jgi:hypothetical protein
MIKIPCEIYSRVVGYFRPLKQWNPGKQAEFKDRNEYDPKKIMEAVSEKLARHSKTTSEKGEGDIYP